MRVGGKRTLRIPPSLAYGDKGAGALIGPGAHIEFDCELKRIVSNPMEKFAIQNGMNTKFEAPTITLTILGAAIVAKLLGGVF